MPPNKVPSSDYPGLLGDASSFLEALGSQLKVEAVQPHGKVIEILEAQT